MKKKLSYIALALAGVLFASCMGDDYAGARYDETPFGNNALTDDNVISIAALKDKYQSAINTDYRDGKAYEQVTGDLKIKGVVTSSDEQGNIFNELAIQDSTGAILLSVAQGGLYSFLPVGTEVLVDLKGLYVGCYSKLPKIGQPYYTSSGNLRLGPILLQLCSTNVELVGKPNPDCPECKPVELSPEWLRATANRNYLYYPQLVTVRGTIQEADGEAIFAPESLQDAGYGVDRTLVNSTNNTKVTIRTSTQNDISFTVMPQGEHAYTGLLSYYSNWQVQLRSVDDIQ